MTLAMPYPFRTLTCTRADVEQDKREVANILHVEEEFLTLRLYP